MTQAVLDVTLEMTDGRTLPARAVVDSGSFHTVIRANVLPTDAPMLENVPPRAFRVGSQKGGLSATASTIVEIRIGEKKIRDEVWVSPDLGREMLIGAGTMQKWDISILNENGHTRVTVGRDVRDPETNEID